jgi:hypothetical protein
MVEAIEGYLASWLGNASAVGASSWFHWLSWTAALLIALFAWLAIKRQSLQSRATLLLNIHNVWQGCGEERPRAGIRRRGPLP